MNAAVVDIFNPDGSVDTYKPLAARLGDFLKVYGPKEGYRIQTEVKDWSCLSPGLVEVYKAALTSGQGIDRLPPILPTFVFEAKLIDREGEVVASGSAMRTITASEIDIDDRIWEAAETAALQRLAARLGFSGDVLSKDETFELRRRGVQTRRQDDKSPSANIKPIKSSDEMSLPKSEPSSNEEPEKKVAKTSSSGVSEALIRQVHHWASLRGVEPPEIRTKAEAKEAIKRLQGSQS